MSELADVYERMTEWARDLVQKDPKLQPLAGMLYRTNSYKLFINILRMQPDIQPSILACKRFDGDAVDREVNRLIDIMLVQNDFTREDFNPSDINKINQYLKLWVDVIAFS
jgi:hypothetical protein